LAGRDPRRPYSAGWTLLVSIEGPPRLKTIDALAHLQLTVRRAGGTVRLHAAGAELRELIRLAGLGEVFECDGLVVGMSREPEPGEQCRGEEMMDVSDSPG
jgi:hypothetical protein